MQIQYSFVHTSYHVVIHAIVTITETIEKCQCLQDTTCHKALTIIINHSYDSYNYFTTL